jgi:hypothetical protein
MNHTIVITKDVSYGKQISNMFISHHIEFTHDIEDPCEICDMMQPIGNTLLFSLSYATKIISHLTTARV